MGLEQYIIALVTFVNNLVIPFLMGLAFLFFVVNAVRFFVVGGANADSKEKAKSLAVYGLLAFVLIIIFWGIVGLLTSSLGLQALGDRTARCFDYDPNCDVTPSEQTNSGANVAGNFGATGIGDPRPQGIGTPSGGFPTGSGFTSSETDTSPTRPSNPGPRPSQPSEPAGVPEYNAFLSTENNIRPVADTFMRTQAPDLFGRHTIQVSDDLFADLPQAEQDTSFSDIDRVQAGMRLAISGAISSDVSLQYQNQLESYYEAVSPGYFNDTIAPTLQAIERDIPPNVQSNFNQTLALIGNELTTYYSSIGLGLTSAEVSESVANDLANLRSGPVDDRFSALEDLYDQNILRDPDNIIYDQFSEDMNVINIYAGETPDF